MAEIATLGPRAAYDLLLGVNGIDPSRVLNFQMRQGLTPQGVLQDAASAIGAVNTAIIARWGGMLYSTEDLFARYRQGENVASKTPKKAEFVPADAVRSDTTGHMLPMGEYEDALGWTEQYLRDAYQSQIDSDLELISERWYLRAEGDIVARILRPTENPIGTGYDVPWAIGNSANAPYIPSARDGKPFTDAHTHFLFENGVNSATALTLANKMMGHLREHGFRGRLQLLVSEADVDTWAGVSKFVGLQPSGMVIIPGNGAATQQVITGETEGMPGELFGYLNLSRGVAELRYYEAFPAHYAFMTKSFGVNNPNNGVALRLHPSMPFGLRPDLRIVYSTNPEIQSIALKAMHGVGVNRRLNGVAGYFNTGAVAYVDPVAELA